MQNIYSEVGSLDARCYKEFGLSEDILMENAAQGMAGYIKKRFKKGSHIIVLSGSGNNGADGITLSRILHKEYKVELLILKKPSSPMAILQYKRAKLVGVKEIKKLKECDVVVDAFVGTGFKGEINIEVKKVFKEIERLKAFKIACDVVSANLFSADVTLTMGALKKSMFLDDVKDLMGEIKVIDLGISREVYETQTNYHLLDIDDLITPKRVKSDTHKGSYGHLNVLGGDKLGAGVLAAMSAFRFGAGLVSIITTKKTKSIPYYIMNDRYLSKNVTAIACGMGLSKDKKRVKELLDISVPMVLDADIFSMKIIKKFLHRDDIVLTPHPKEFVSLLKICDIADIGVSELQKNRFLYIEMFCQKYPNPTIVLKGANVIISSKNRFYINPHGDAKLAKGGSGDVLAGLIASLLTQGYTPLHSAINGSLAHTKLAQNYTLSDFSLTPEDLIKGIGNL